MKGTAPRGGTGNAGAGTADRHTRGSKRKTTGQGGALGTAKDKTEAILEGARERAADSLAASRQSIATYPLLSVAGGLTAGIALGMLLPRSRREKELLFDVGHKVTDAAREAADNAVEAGRQQVDDIKQNAIAKVGEAMVEAVTSPQSR